MKYAVDCTIFVEAQDLDEAYQIAASLEVRGDDLKDGEYVGSRDFVIEKVSVEEIIEGA